MTNAPVILYIEDNRDNRKLVSRVLQADGFIVDGATNAQDAIIYLETKTPHLILMDINLPDTDVYTLTSQLRQHENLTTIPIIALTANVMKQDREKSLAAGCNGFIQKPINVDSLPEQLRAYLNSNK